ncbi:MULTISPECIES: thioredoxin family protein [Xanthomonas translucens group]|uniref:thioredoxin family protein n=1 Tax=Xanthomonas translucens group TaxID=3390202 RepID=UPI0005793C29|nr:thioredoxin family protein [Xanthomonas translucens]UKE47530.1 thioredoxin family protein [Xanthomonas translucens pv. cerealis]UKE69883.1 thioredoxin family protein [Xanthomonas translucens pv. pistacia]
MRRRFRLSVMTSASLAATLMLGGCDKPPAPAKPQAVAPAKAPDSAGIAWREGDVEDAFAEAREQNKPLLLYWGAAWCPPCNHLKATLFKDPAFIARTRAFVAVHLDGDSKGAQAWGERFGILGYPTIIVLRPDRSEITRLAGGSDTASLAEALRVAATRTTTSAQLLQKAMQAPATLSADDWTLLSGYSWTADASSVVKPEQTAGVLAKLAAAAPQPALQRQFALLALAAQEPDKAGAIDARQRAANRRLLLTVLADPAEVRANHTSLTYSTRELVQAAATDAAERGKLSDALSHTLDQIYADSSLPINDRLGTAIAEVELAWLAQGKPADPGNGPYPPLPAAVVAKVQQRVQWAQQAAKTDAERQSTISTAASLLDIAGDSAGAEQLLLAELGRSKTPYYYMPELADLAEKRGDKQTALYWLKKAYESAEGPATRVQWGVLYVDGLIRLQPDNAAAIEAAAGQVIGELAGQPGGYHQRTKQRFDTLAKALQGWSKGHGGSAVLARLQHKMQENCGSQDRDSCQHWLS